MENKSVISSSETKEVLHNIETKVQQLDSALQIINDNGTEKKLFQDSLHSSKNYCDKQAKQIDSLKKIINSLSQKPKTKQAEGKK